MDILHTCPACGTNFHDAKLYELSDTIVTIRGTCSSCHGNNKIRFKYVINYNGELLFSNLKDSLPIIYNEKEFSTVVKINKSRLNSFVDQIVSNPKNNEAFLILFQDIPVNYLFHNELNILYSYFGINETFYIHRHSEKQAEFTYRPTKFSSVHDDLQRISIEKDLAVKGKSRFKSNRTSKPVTSDDLMESFNRMFYR